MKHDKLLEFEAAGILMPHLGSLAKFDYKPLGYVWEIDGHFVTFTAAQIGSPKGFYDRCLHSNAKTVVPLLSRDQYNRVLAEAFKTMVVYNPRNPMKK